MLNLKIKKYKYLSMSNKNNEIWELKIDEIDLAILKYLYQLKPKEVITSTDLVKKIFNTKNKYETIKLDNFIRYRLEKLNNIGVLVRDVLNGKYIYMVDTEKVKITKNKIEMVIKGKKVIIKNLE